jgi:hypothetical protein
MQLLLFFPASKMSMKNGHKMVTDKKQKQGTIRDICFIMRKRLLKEREDFECKRQGWETSLQTHNPKVVWQKFEHSVVRLNGLEIESILKVLFVEPFGLLNY